MLSLFFAKNFLFTFVNISSNNFVEMHGFLENEK